MYTSDPRLSLHMRLISKLFIQSTHTIQACPSVETSANKGTESVKVLKVPVGGASKY